MKHGGNTITPVDIASHVNSTVSFLWPAGNTEGRVDSLILRHEGINSFSKAGKESSFCGVKCFVL